MPIEKTRRRLRTADMNRYRRIISQRVIETHAELVASLGTAQALDYSRLTGAQGIQNGTNLSMFIGIDYIADVLKAAKDTLSNDDLRWYLGILNKSSPDFTRQTEEQMRIHERMGRCYLGRGLFPLSRYLYEVN